jgi:hypothetical protein
LGARRRILPARKSTAEIDADARRPEGDKIMRLHAETATIENGFVWLPEEAPWLADCLAEFAAFPRGRHDDQVDSTAQALAWTKLPRTGPEAWIEFYGRPWKGEQGEGRLSGGGSRRGDDGVPATGEAQSLGAPG